MVTYSRADVQRSFLKGVRMGVLKGWNLLNIIGLISGTSMDAIDAALVNLERIDDRLRLHPLAFTMAPIPPALRNRLLALLPPHSGSTAEVCMLNVAIGEAFATAALLVARQAG